MPKLRKSTTFILGDSVLDVEHPIGPSETIPDMALSLHDILSRHTRGLEVPTYNPLYSDEEYPDFSRMDLSEIQEYKELNREHIDSIRRELQEASEAMRTKQAPKAITVQTTDFDTPATSDPVTQS